MQELKVIGIENGAVIAASEDGDRFRLVIDAVMQTKIRQLHNTRTTTARVSPREIQAHVRAGMTTEQVAAATGASLEDIEKYEGPVLAEREHMLANALACNVHVAGDDASGHTFGGVIRERLAALDAVNERWACWKDEHKGWLVKVEFTADDIDHDARWSFDARAQALQPINSEAITLSQHGEIRGGLIPKLRAVDAEHEATDTSRFDSGAFVLTDSELAAAALLETQPVFDLPPMPAEPSSPEATAAAVNREDQPAHNPSDTADLLEALRKRRGERQEPPQFDMYADHTEASDHRETVVIERETVIIERETTDVQPGEGARSIWGSTSITEVDEVIETDTIEPAPVAEIDNAPKRRNGRTSLPSWDEIVFGSKHDENDPA